MIGLHQRVSTLNYVDELTSMLEAMFPMQSPDQMAIRSEGYRSETIAGKASGSAIQDYNFALPFRRIY